MALAFLESVHANPWSETFLDLPTLNAHASDAIESAIRSTREIARSRPAELHSTCLTVLGPAGAGKTHLFGRLRRRLGPRAVFVHIRPLLGVQMTHRFVLQEIVRQLGFATVGLRQVDALVGSLLAHLRGGSSVFPQFFVEDYARLEPAALADRLEEGVDQVLSRWQELDEIYLRRLVSVPFRKSPADRALLAWLSGRELDAIQLERVGTSGALAEEVVLPALKTLAAVASVGAPIVVVFDQLENLIDRELAGSRLLAYAQLTTDLVDSVQGLVIVQMALDTEWTHGLLPSFNLAQRSRLTMQSHLLGLPTPREKEELLRLWLERLPDRAAPYPWPLGEARATELCTQPGMTPRMLLIALRQMLEEGLATASTPAPNPERPEFEAPTDDVMDALAPSAESVAASAESVAASAESVAASAEGVAASAESVAASAESVAASAESVAASAEGVAASAEGVAASAEGVAASGEPHAASVDNGAPTEIDEAAWSDPILDLELDPAPPAPALAPDPAPATALDLELDPVALLPSQDAQAAPGESGLMNARSGAAAVGPLADGPRAAVGPLADGPGAAIGGVPSVDDACDEQTRRDEALELAWEDRLASARELLDEAAAQSRSTDPARLIDGVLASLRFVPSLRPLDVGAARPAQIRIARGDSEVHLALLHQSHYRSVALTLTKLAELAQAHEVVAIREQAQSLPPTWVDTLARLEAFVARPKARWLWLAREQAARLLALDDFLKAARSCDVTDHQGRGVNEPLVCDWVERNLAVAQWPLFAVLRGEVATDALVESPAPSEGSASSARADVPPHPPDITPPSAVSEVRSSSAPRSPASSAVPEVRSSSAPRSPASSVVPEVRSSSAPRSPTPAARSSSASRSPAPAARSGSGQPPTAPSLRGVNGASASGASASPTPHPSVPSPGLRLDHADRLDHLERLDSLDRIDRLGPVLSVLTRLRLASLERLLREVSRVDRGCTRASVLSQLESLAPRVRWIGRSILFLKEDEP